MLPKRLASACVWQIGVLLFVVAQMHLAHAAPDLLLAKVLPAHVDPKDYLVSEKYDGARAVWDGKTLRFRSGNIVNAPKWFIEKLPSTALDGELWIARGKFELLSGIVRKNEPIDAEWREVKYMVFELPNAAGTFEERFARMQAIARETNWPQLQVAEQFRVADRKALKKKLDEVVKGGAEGLMLHRADAPYVTGRSDVLYKLKPLEDTEAKVVAIISGKGKHAGKMGALRVQMPDGREFNIGTGFTDEQRANPPALGTEVTYSYRGLTNTGLPRFASFLRVREKF
jgi:DNA ligase-1